MSAAYKNTTKFRINPYLANGILSLKSYSGIPDEIIAKNYKTTAIYLKLKSIGVGGECNRIVRWEIADANGNYLETIHNKKYRPSLGNTEKGGNTEDTTNG